MATPTSSRASPGRRRRVRLSVWLFVLAGVLYLLEWRGAGIGLGVLAFVVETFSAVVLIMKDPREDEDKDVWD